MSEGFVESGTRERILAVVEDLMMERGFNAISYQDVAARIGIRKASIHYHFPTKGDLGVAVIRQYASKMQAAMQSPETIGADGHASAFEGFLQTVAAVADSPRKVCLGGVLGAEYVSLPEPMQVEVRRFYEGMEDWLAHLLGTGREAGAFNFESASEDLACVIVAALEGALIIRRALASARPLDAALEAARRMAGVRGG